MVKMLKKQMAWLYAGYCFLYIYFCNKLLTKNVMEEYNASTVRFV